VKSAIFSLSNHRESRFYSGRAKQIDRVPEAHKYLANSHKAEDKARKSSAEASNTQDNRDYVAGEEDDMSARMEDRL
jgi:hypothetical protein